MTWGQLRLQLQTAAPGVPLDLLDEWLDTRYEQVLEATDWKGLTAHGTIQTQAAYQSATDTVTATVGSAAVTGLLTAWTSAITGDKFYIPGDTVTYVATYVSATSLTLDRPYEGNGVDAGGVVYAKSPYVFMQNVYPLPADCRTVATVLDPASGAPMQSFTKDGLDAAVGIRTLVSYPKSWAQYDDTPESAPPVLHQIEFYPPPLQARGFPLEYERNANFFTGQNTSTSPLPFVSNSVLLYGVRADIGAHLEKYEQATMYEGKFGEELARLLRVEHQQRRVKTNMKMASRFTRHRMARAERSFRNNWGPGAGGPN